MVEEDKSFGQKIRDTYNKDKYQVEIEFPSGVYRDFRRWAKSNAANCYWLAIEKLMMYYNQQEDIHTHVRLLADRDDMISYELQQLKDEVALLRSTPVKKEFKHFGKKKDE